jgi:putative sterol carrier protein
MPLMTLDELTQAIRSKAEGNPPLNYKIKFEVDEGTVFWDGTGPTPVVTNEDGEADTTIAISTDDLVKLTKGELNPTLAYMTGRLKVSGSMGVALKMSQMLED